MKFRLQHICPEFLPGTESQVWNGDLHWPEKSMINVAAPSGTGKTTFIAILYGLFRNYTGTLKFDDRDVTLLSRNEWARLRQRTLSVMFQDLRLFDQLSCLDNVLLKNSQGGVSNKDRIESAFERLGIAARLHAPAGTCSQGEKQRVAFIRALMQPFEWILLDEPFSHLDDTCIAAMCELLLDICDKNNGGMIVTSLAPDPWLPYDRTVAL